MESNTYMKKQNVLIILGMCILIISVVGITLAFFNYTRTGTVNTIRVGRISFVSKNEQTISLSNLFPIDPSNTTDMNDNTKVGTYSIDIEGDTDYVDGIEYLVSITNANIYTSTGKTVPISINVTTEDLGSPNANYFTARESKDTLMYKKIIGDTIVGDGMLLVGFIPQNNPTGTADGIDGSITIKAYFDENKILISDTYDGTESDNMGTPNSLAQGKTVLTKTEWNSLQANGVSFQVKVEANEGIWVNGSLEEIMRTKNYSSTLNRGIRDDEASDYVTSNSGINFSTISSDTNGKGVYMRAGTQNDAHPILYYRGEVEDNNVLFNNKCWKVVRTTDTGGVKLIYNGELSRLSAPLAESDYTILTNTGSMTFDTTDNAWVVHSTEAIESQKEISFSVPNGDGYLLEIFGSSGSSISGGMYRGTSGTYQKNNDFGGSGGHPISASITSFGTMATGDSIKVTYYGTGTSSQELILKVRVIHPDETLGMGCDNQGPATQITVNNTNTFAFNTNANSPAYSGYMYGTVYIYNYFNWTSEARFGSGFTWDGTNYTLVDDSVTTPNATHHYSCNVTTEGGTCTQLRYVYYRSGSYKYYIILTGGDGIEEALAKMNTNTNDSNAKDKIETWYEDQMDTVTNKLEDTIWCNDRSFGDNNNNGWIANGGGLSTYLYYGAKERSDYASDTSTVKNQPSLGCANKNDRFTWKNGAGNGALDYPVGMITEDEMVLAGGKAGTTNGSFYLKSGVYYWSLSPSHFTNSGVSGFGLIDVGGMTSGTVRSNFVDRTYGLRPVVSLKPGTPVVSGSGTVADPYIIG